MEKAQYYNYVSFFIIYFSMQLFSVYITNTGPRRERSYNCMADKAGANLCK
jgi:hypothetical protein